LSTVPASPGQSSTPKVKGTAESGSTVKVYDNSACTGSPVASGSASDFGSTGLTASAVADGSTTSYYAMATDAAQNTSACSSDHADYTQQPRSPDATAPTVTVFTSPAGPPSGQDGWFNAHDLSAAGGKITVHVSATDSSGVTSLDCTDNGHAVTVAGQSGSSPRTGSFAVSSDGTHVVSCKATDGASPSNTGAEPGSHPTASVKIDTRAPTASTGSLPRFGREHTIRVRWAGTDGESGLRSFDVRQRRAHAGSGSFSSFGALRTATSTTGARLTGVEGNTTCFSTRARDRAGNLSSYTSEKCTTTPLDDRKLARAGRWHLGGHAGYYTGTYMRTTTPGATLTSPLISGAQIALLVTTSPHAGMVNVSWHGHTRALNFRSPRTENRRVILTGFTGTGRLRIQTLDRRAVVIDGLGVWKYP
jgi:hypothetical protein